MGVVTRPPEPPRRPIFWFLWPRPDPHAPLDAAYRQQRWIRVIRQGPWRLAFLVPFSLAVVTGLASVAVAAATAGSGGTIERIGVLAAVALVGGLALLLLSRAWVVGTYVNDGGARVSQTWRSTVVPWTAVVAVHRGPGRARLLGLPLQRPAVRVDLVLDDGTVLPTHVTSVSPDLLGRPEAFDIAALTLQRWWEETRRAP